MTKEGLEVFRSLDLERRSVLVVVGKPSMALSNIDTEMKTEI